MHSLQDIFGDKDFGTPKEITLIKDFVRKQLQRDVEVTVHPHSITIVVASAGLAGALRPFLYKLTKELGTQKKIYIRIG